MDAEEKIRVLLVDDYALVRDGMKALLENCYDISVIAEATNGQQALKLVEQLKPDVVVTDISMPEMDGIAVMENIIMRASDTKILVVSSYLSPTMVDKVLSAGATGCILKDYVFAELADAIRAVNNSEEYLCTSF
jgi:DNA-binding NarL/FixJ family response regulator